MLTIHTADEVRCAWGELGPVRGEPEAVQGEPEAGQGGTEPVEGGGVVVDGSRVAAVGPLAELIDRFPGARVRRWPGVLGPALVHDGPLPDAPTPRERVHAVLKSGAVAVLAEHAHPPGLRSAAERNDVLVLPRPRPTTITEGARADLAAFDDGACVATVCAGRLVHRRR